MPMRAVLVSPPLGGLPSVGFVSMQEMYEQYPQKSITPLVRQKYVCTIVASNKSRLLLKQQPGRNHKPTFPPECDVALAILADTSQTGRDVR